MSIVSNHAPEVLDALNAQHAETDQQPRGRVRKPRPKPPRSIRLELPLNAEGRNGVVRITVGKETGDYFFDRVPADFGTAFKVEEIGGDEAYHVHFDDTGRRSCECKGYLRWSRCKHVEGLAKLIELGKIASPIKAAVA